MPGPVRWHESGLRATALLRTGTGQRTRTSGRNRGGCYCGGGDRCPGHHRSHGDDRGHQSDVVRVRDVLAGRLVPRVPAAVLPGAVAAVPAAVAGVRPAEIALAEGFAVLRVREVLAVAAVETLAALAERLGATSP